MFLFTFTSFGVILILGGPRYATLETEIYRQTAQLLNLPARGRADDRAARRGRGAARASTGWIRAARGVALAAARGRARPRAGRAPARRRALLGANLAVMALLLGGAARSCSSSGRSTHPAGYGLDFYRALGEVHAGSTLFVPPVDAIANSLRFAAIATVIAVVVGGCAAFALARRRAARPRRAASRCRSASRR